METQNIREDSKCYYCRDNEDEKRLKSAGKKCCPNCKRYFEEVTTTNLRDNPDGTCNCKPLGDGCFFTSESGGRCDCKCHFPKPQTTKEQVMKSEVLEDIKWDLDSQDRKKLDDFISSTYDTAYEEGLQLRKDYADIKEDELRSAYEKGVRDAMGRIGEEDNDGDQGLYDVGQAHKYGATQERSRLRLALSELLKK